MGPLTYGSRSLHLIVFQKRFALRLNATARRRQVDSASRVPPRASGRILLPSLPFHLFLGALHAKKCTTSLGEGRKGERAEPAYSGEERHVASDDTLNRTAPSCPLTQDPSVGSYPLRSDAGLTLNLRSAISWGVWLAGGGDLVPPHF